MLLAIEHLTVEYGTGLHQVRAVDDASLTIDSGQILGLVGESGSGKTTLGLAITRLLPRPSARIVSGAVQFQGRNLLALSEPELCRVRGGHVAYIFQEPSTSLNPVMTVGEQLIEMLSLHTPLRGLAARARAEELCKQVGIPAAVQRLHNYPHELSGGMKQRIMIAMAIAAGPKLLVADEPTTALDVTLERQIVLLLKRLQRELGLSLLVISHSIPLVSQLAGRLAVMWQGRIVEEGPVQQVLSAPVHDYTRRLLAAQPMLTL